MGGVVRIVVVGKRVQQNGKVLHLLFAEIELCHLIFEQRVNGLEQIVGIAVNKALDHGQQIGDRALRVGVFNHSLDDITAELGRNLIFLGRGGEIFKHVVCTAGTVLVEDLNIECADQKRQIVYLAFVVFLTHQLVRCSGHKAIRALQLGCALRFLIRFCKRLLAARAGK